MDGGADKLSVPGHPTRGPTQPGGSPVLLADSAGVLLERNDAERRLDQVLASSRSSVGQCAFLVAPAGVGKTALLDLAARSWQAAGLPLGHAVGSPMETEIPFGLIDRATSMLGGTEAIREVSDIDHADPGLSRFYRTMRWLEKTCATAPVLLALDDLHWSDDDSIGLIGYICRRIRQLPVAVLGTLRPEPSRANSLVEDLAATAGAHLVPLTPLTRDSCSVLAARFLPRDPTEVEADAIWRSTGGVPLLVEAAAEGLNHGTEPGNLTEARWDPPLFLLKRFAGLGEEPFSYATKAAIFGIRFRRVLAARLAGLDETDGARAHDRLVRAHLLEELDGGLSRFVHPLFAQGLLDALGPASQQELHARAFRLLLETGAPDAEAAEHAYAASLYGDPLAVEVMARAGRSAAAQGAFRAATTHFARAIELAGDRAELPLRLAHASMLVALARVEEASQRCEELLADFLLPTSARAEALRLLGQSAFMANRPADAQRLFEEAATTCSDQAAEGRGLFHAALTCLPTSTVYWVERTAKLALVRLDGQAPELPSCNLLHAYAQLLTADPSKVAVVEDALTQWMAGTFPVEPGARWAIAFHLHGATRLLERYDDALRIFESEYSRARRDGSPLLAATVAISHADMLHRLGRTARALDLVNEASALSDHNWAPWVNVAQAALLCELDRVADASTHFAILRDFASAAPRGFGAAVALWADTLEARLLLEAGQPEAASDVMADARELSEETGLLHPLVVPWWPVAVEAHLRAGRRGLAEALADHMEQIAVRLELRWPAAVAALARAQLSEVGEEAERRFEAAVKLHHEAAQPLYSAEALIAYGTYLRRARRPLEARERLREAVAIAESSGSRRLARRAHAELAAAGGRRARLAPRDGLTSRERQVAELAAAGHSNAEIAVALFLSAKTVEHHLESIYRKLGINSRRSLMMGGGSSAGSAPPWPGALSAAPADQ